MYASWQPAAAFVYASPEKALAAVDEQAATCAVHQQQHKSEQTRVDKEPFCPEWLDHALLLLLRELVEGVERHSEMNDELLVEFAVAAVLSSGVLPKHLQSLLPNFIALKVLLGKVVCSFDDLLGLRLSCLQVVHYLQQIRNVVVYGVVVYFWLEQVIEPLNFARLLLE